jgi:4-amino-4-deoxy-L-arabinose transferase-like glycosyltransferase
MVALKASWRSLGIVLALYLLLAVLYGLVTPIYEGPDEIGHVLYVKHLFEGQGLPRQTREYALAYGFGQEGSQPPLYYALNAALVRVLRLSLASLEGVPPVNPFTTCGRPARYNVACYRHDPRQEIFPFQGAARAIHVMRLLSALLGGITVTAVYLATRQAFPGSEEAALLAAALVAFNPQFTFMGGVVNNDNLVNCLVAMAVALTLYGLRHGFTWRRALVLGLVCGLAALAKLGGLAALAFAGMGLLVNVKLQIANCRLQIVDRRRHWALVISHASLVIGVVLLVAGWWFVRNWVLHGEPTGATMMHAIYGERDDWPARLVLPEIRKTFRSYWSRFPCELSFPRPVHSALGLLVGVGVGGWVRGWRAISRRERRTGGLLLVWLGLVVLAWVRWNQISHAPHGRLFFQANAAIGGLLGYGLARLTPRPRRVLVGVGIGLWALAMAGALLVVRPAFAPPPRYPASAPPVPPQPLPQATFGDRISVSGYEVSPRSLEPGRALNVALFLQASRPVTEDYALALQLLSPVPGDDTTLVNFNTIPGGGTYPTYSWRPDEVIVDRYRLEIPERVERAHAWRVVAIFYRLSDGERLPVTVAGQPAGEMLGLGMVRVGASEPLDVPSQARMEPAPVFGETIALQGAQVTLVEKAEVRVSLWWKALAAPDKDYTVFVHLLDDDGQLVGTGDGPPLWGGFPTRTWQFGDGILDEHVVPLSPDLAPGDYAITVGWYDPATGARLPLVRGVQQAGDAVIVGDVSLP